MTIMGQEKPSLDDLMHHGVKGMKWGVHKQRKLERYNRIANGEGTARDHLHLARTVSPLEIALNKGSIKNLAANRAKLLQAQKDRVESGNATSRDKLDRALNTPLHHLVRGK